MTNNTNNESNTNNTTIFNYNKEYKKMQKELLKQQLQTIFNTLKKYQSGLVNDFVADYPLNYIKYLYDAFSERADNIVDIYYYDLKKWVKDEDNAVGLLEDAIDKGLIDTHNYDFYKHIQAAQFLGAERELYNNDEDIKKMLFINQVLEDLDELPDELDSYKYIDQYIEDAAECNEAEDLKDLVKDFEDGCEIWRA